MEADWFRDVGQGISQHDRNVTTIKSGLITCNVARRITRDIKTGEVIDDSIPDNEPDNTLHRWTQPCAHARVELVMEDVGKPCLLLGPDVSELYSPPRIAPEAGLRSYGGRKSKAGWSLDIAVDDPEKFRSGGNIISKVSELIKNGTPYMIICSPMCTAFSQI